MSSPNSLSLSPVSSSKPSDVIDTSPVLKPPRKAASNQTIFLGNSRILEEIRKAIKAPAIHFKMDPLSSKYPKDLTFVRDSRVVRKDGVHLIPYSIQNPLLSGYFQSLLPENSNHFILNSKGLTGYGCGFEENQRKQALETAKKYGQHFLAATTCIEGGNCFLTKEEAIVGIHSVILSMIALHEQNLFNEEQLAKHADSIETPSPMFVRMARNSAVYAQKRPFDDKLKDHKGWSPLREEIRKLFGGESGYKKLLTAPLIKSDYIDHLSAAKQWQACWEKTLETMAEELGVKTKSLVVIDQVHFHIDLDIALGPKRLLLVQDPQKSLDLLGGLVSRGKGAYYNHFQTILTHMQSEAPNQLAVLKQNIPKFERLNLRVLRMPGVFQNAFEERVNLLNGLFLRCSRGVFFATQGTTNRFDSYLLEPFAEHLLKQKIQPIFLEALQQPFIESNGGLRCLTWESPFILQQRRKKTSTSLIDKEQSVSTTSSSTETNKKQNIG